MGVGGTDRFKAVFKRYKKKDADLGDAIDFAKPSKQDKEVQKSQFCTCFCDLVYV